MNGSPHQDRPWVFFSKGPNRDSQRAYNTERLRMQYKVSFSANVASIFLLMLQIVSSTPILSDLNKDKLKYNQALENCKQSGPMDLPYYDIDTDEYICYTLFEKGPCLNENEWLVAKPISSGIPLAECEIKKCKGEEIFYDNQCWKMFLNKEQYNEMLCGKSKVMVLNPFGEGEYTMKVKFKKFNFQIMNVYSNLDVKNLNIVNFAI